MSLTVAVGQRYSTNIDLLGSMTTGLAGQTQQWSQDPCAGLAQFHESWAWTHSVVTVDKGEALPAFNLRHY
jgi:hypothetical protein